MADAVAGGHELKKSLHRAGQPDAAIRKTTITAADGRWETTKQEQADETYTFTPKTLENVNKCKAKVHITRPNRNPIDARPPRLDGKSKLD